ncbi:MAG: ATP synthase F1 subunit gamma [Candidatus Magasanikbacteria bacterium RIFCSPHIGHO2_02_FULL_50_9b]|nr:MAG: ATP synthase F1 subunit gamma [Candidatus Magasanikbacteria bacterium RIFCSPHIGHO2_02_FULL_50_9b]
MELVSAAKMRRAVAAALASRHYAKYAWELLLRLRQSANGETNIERHPLLVERPVRKILLIAVTSNRGLAGAFSTNIIKKVVEQIRNPHQIARNRVGNRWVEPVVADPQIDFVVLGKRGEAVIRKFTNNIIASFVDISDVPKYADVEPLIKLAIDAYRAREYDKVAIVYTDYVSALVQKTKIRQILPVSEADLEKVLFENADEAAGDVPTDSAAFGSQAVFEPSVQEIITVAVTRLIESQVFQSVLESAASEHSARMMSMRSATDAATDMIDSLTLVFNQARQASITREISEISAGKAALE